MNDNLLLTLREISQTGRRHASKIVIFNACVLLLAVLAILFWPRQYGSEAKLWLKIGRENSRLDPSASTGETVHITESSREDEVKSVLDVICSRGVITQVVNSMTPSVVLGDAPNSDSSQAEGNNVVRDTVNTALSAVGQIIGSIDPVSDKERAIREISENVYAEAQRRSNVIKVHCASTSPELAQRILNRLIEQYQTQHTDIHRTTGSLPFFDEQCASLKKRVESNAAELTELMKKINVASIDGQRQNLEAEMLHVQTSKLNAESDFSKASALVTELTELLQSHPQYIKAEEKNVPNTGRDELQKSLYDLQVTRMELEAKHAKNHPLVKRARAQEESAVAKLTEAATMSRSEISEALNTVHQSLALDLAKAHADQAAHRATLASILRHEEKLVDKIAKLNEADIEIKQKQRELALSEENYINYAKSVEDARINEALSESAISNIAIAQAPTFQEKPVSPSKGLIGAVAMAAMFFGTIVLVGFYQATDSVHFQREITAITQEHLSIEDAMKLNRHQNVRLLVLRGDLNEEETLKALNGNGKSEKPNPNGHADAGTAPTQPSERS